MRNLKQHQDFIRLRGLGESFDKIAEKIGVSKQTLLKWSVKYAYELSQVKLKILDNVVEEYDIAKSGRLKIVAKDLLRIDTELSKRDLASIPTSKLMQLKLKALDVAGEILDIKRIEIGGSVEISDSMSRWEKIITQCGILPDEGYKDKEIRNKN